ncbi:TPA: hypothetical protein KFU03_002594 [Escherichia coli]|nr:hypothetical protein [Escherichia coli]
MNNRFYMMCLRETVGNNASLHCHNGNGYSSGRGEAFMMQKHGEMAMKQGKRLSKYIVMSGVGE